MFSHWCRTEHVSRLLAAAIRSPWRRCCFPPNFQSSEKVRGIAGWLRAISKLQDLQLKLCEDLAGSCRWTAGQLEKPDQVELQQVINNSELKDKEPFPPFMEETTWKVSFTTPLAARDVLKFCCLKQIDKRETTDILKITCWDEKAQTGTARHGRKAEIREKLWC